MTLSNSEKKQEAIQQVPFWWHTIDLGDGVVTPGHIRAQEQQIRTAAIPSMLQEKTVLDLGCWDGFFSFWCERRGAIVTPVDNFQYRNFIKSKYGVELQGGEGFQVAAHWLGSKLKIVSKDFTELDTPFDIVLFLQVLYHQRDPLGTLERLFKLTRECAVVETHYLKDESRPILQFYPGTSFNSDPTNFWGPSLSCVELMLLDVGFRNVKLVSTYEGVDDNRVIFLAEK